MEGANGEECEKVTVVWSVLSAIVPEKLVPAPFLTVNIVELDQLCTGSLNVALIGEATVTLVAPLAGLVLVTVGGVLSVEAVEAAVVFDTSEDKGPILPALSTAAIL